MHRVLLLGGHLDPSFLAGGIVVGGSGHTFGDVGVCSSDACLAVHGGAIARKPIRLMT